MTKYSAIPCPSAGRNESIDDNAMVTEFVDAPPNEREPAIHERAGSAMDTSGSSVQSSTQRNEAMLDMSMRRSFQDVRPVLC
mmetsp:Transcript_10028/g.22213  ORF Transcript_10028/g.22213 Transcript_10028/m.22213 type:complete len:82 (-) Transcript_10028:245-490(-)